MDTDLAEGCLVGKVGVSSQGMWAKSYVICGNYIRFSDPQWGWHIYLHEWSIFVVNVGKYTIH